MSCKVCGCKLYPCRCTLPDPWDFFRYGEMFVEIKRDDPIAMSAWESVWARIRRLLARLGDAWRERFPPPLPWLIELTDEELERLERVPFRAVFRVRRVPLPRATIIARRRR